MGCPLNRVAFYANIACLGLYMNLYKVMTSFTSSTALAKGTNKKCVSYR